jgi:hypothetical protein
MLPRVAGCSTSPAKSAPVEAPRALESPFKDGRGGGDGGRLTTDRGLPKLAPPLGFRVSEASLDERSRGVRVPRNSLARGLRVSRSVGLVGGLCREDRRKENRWRAWGDVAASGGLGVLGSQEVLATGLRPLLLREVRKPLKEWRLGRFESALSRSGSGD